MFFELSHILLSWTNKCHPTIVLSSIKLEYRSLSNGAKNITWFQTLLKELQFLDDEPT
jgi:hypothetical protein